MRHAPPGKQKRQKRIRQFRVPCDNGEGSLPPTRSRPERGAGRPPPPRLQGSITSASPPGSPVGPPRSAGSRPGARRGHAWQAQKPKSRCKEGLHTRGTASWANTPPPTPPTLPPAPRPWGTQHPVMLGLAVATKRRPPGPQATEPGREHGWHVHLVFASSSLPQIKPPPHIPLLKTGEGLFWFSGGGGKEDAEAPPCLHNYHGPEEDLQHLENHFLKTWRTRCGAIRLPPACPTDQKNSPKNPPKTFAQATASCFSGGKCPECPWPRGGPRGPAWRRTRRAGEAGEAPGASLHLEAAPAGLLSAVAVAVPEVVRGLPQQPLREALLGCVAHQVVARHLRAGEGEVPEERHPSGRRCEAQPTPGLLPRSPLLPLRAPGQHG